MLQGGSLYTGLCRAVGSMGWLVQFSLQYNCTQEILQGGMSAEEKCSTQLRRGALQTRECWSCVECYCEIRAEHHLFVEHWSTLNIPPLCLTLVAVTSHGQLSLTHTHLTSYLVM